MIINTLCIYDISPEISICPETVNEVVNNEKILGTIIRSDMKILSAKKICLQKSIYKNVDVKAFEGSGVPNP